MQHVRKCLLLFRNLDRSKIGLNILIPHAQTRENVRRHVHGMGRSRCDLGIAFCGCESLIRHDGVVAGMNEIVSRAGMIRLPRKYAADDRYGLPDNGEIVLSRIG